MTILARPEAEYREITYAERSAFYETEHATKMDADFLTSFLGPDMQSVLEVPCGVGRNVFLFASTGVHTVGVDLEHQMVAQAKARLRGEAYAKYANTVEFHQGDMRALSLGRRFDLVVTPIDAFQLLPSDADALSALKSLGACLSEVGTLIIDLARFGDETLSDVSRPIFYDPSQPDGKIVQEWVRLLPDGGSLTRSRRQLHDGRTMRFRFFYDVLQTEGARHLYTDLALRTYRRGEIEALITAAGLEIMASFGNHHRGPLVEESARLIYQLRPAR